MPSKRRFIPHQSNLPHLHTLYLNVTDAFDYKGHHIIIFSVIDDWVKYSYNTAVRIYFSVLYLVRSRQPEWGWPILQLSGSILRNKAFLFIEHLPSCFPVDAHGLFSRPDGSALIGCGRYSLLGSFAIRVRHTWFFYFMISNLHSNRLYPITIVMMSRFTCNEIDWFNPYQKKSTAYASTPQDV